MSTADEPRPVEGDVRFKAYVVMAYHSYEGWDVVAECDTFQEAVAERDSCLGMGNSKVQIFKPVELVVTENLQPRHNLEEL